MYAPSQLDQPQTVGMPLEKCPTGITGFDEITGGGLPRGRTSLVCGAAGCGKTLLSTEFLVRGASEYGEPGVFMAFEETADELAKNVRSLGFDLDQLADENKLLIDHIRVERSEIEETGEYDLEAIFIRLNHAIDSIGAKRVVLDTIEALFSGFSNVAVLRAELRRLFRWLKDKGVTAIITAERGDGKLTRHGLEEYISDCVIVLDHRVRDQVATRRMRILKYRGSSHGTNEYPFLIDDGGVDVLPITSVGLTHEASTERISSGIAALDDLLGGKGYFRASSILVSGTAGTGKSSIAAAFVDAACRRGERAVYFAFEESRSQIIRNMRSIGIDLEAHEKADLLYFHAARPFTHGLEMHLAQMYRTIRDISPGVVAVDPVTNFFSVGTGEDIKSMLVRLVDFLKHQGVTALFTNLNHRFDNFEHSDVGVSSLIDTWLHLRNVELNGERNRVLYLHKSRGMAHSNQIREFLITDRGIDLQDVYAGLEGVLTGSARAAQEARERAAELERGQEIERKQAQLERKRATVEAQIAALRGELDSDVRELERAIEIARTSKSRLAEDQREMARRREGAAPTGGAQT